jgi:hypothetical protein
VKVHLEDVIGAKVVDRDGKNAGRITEVRAHREGDACIIDEWHLGAAGLLERLGIGTERLFGLPLFGSARGREPWRVPWQELDLSDPKRPRLRCSIEELPARMRR